MSLLTGEGLALVRGGRLLFEQVDLSLQGGEGLHLVGPNGAGKSSLIRLIAGLLRPTAGRIERAEAALADEQLALDRELPLRRSLEWWGGARLDPAMAAFGLEPLAAVPVRMLSTGQARRARLARVVASGAPLWLLDEPFNGLDAANADALDRAMTAHRAAGGGIVIASHAVPPGTWRTLELGA